MRRDGRCLRVYFFSSMRGQHIKFCAYRCLQWNMEPSAYVWLGLSANAPTLAKFRRGKRSRRLALSSGRFGRHLNSTISYRLADHVRCRRPSSFPRPPRWLILGQLLTARSHGLVCCCHDCWWCRTLIRIGRSVDPFSPPFFIPYHEQYTLCIRFERRHATINGPFLSKGKSLLVFFIEWLPSVRFLISSAGCYRCADTLKPAIFSIGTNVFVRDRATPLTKRNHFYTDVFVTSSELRHGPGPVS